MVINILQTLRRDICNPSAPKATRLWSEWLQEYVATIKALVVKRLTTYWERELPPHRECRTGFMCTNGPGQNGKRGSIQSAPPLLDLVSTCASKTWFQKPILTLNSPMIGPNSLIRAKGRLEALHIFVHWFAALNELLQNVTEYFFKHNTAHTPRSQFCNQPAPGQKNEQ